MNKRWIGIALVVVLVLCVLAWAFQGVLPISPDEAPASEQDSDMDDGVVHEVTFYSNEGAVLKVDRVSNKGCAQPPQVPEMTYGSIFQSWDTDFSRVTQGMEIRPTCVEVADRENVIAVSGGYAVGGGQATIPIRLCGDVCVAGMDVVVRYDADALQLGAVTADGGVVYNDGTAGEIHLNYVSTANTTADVDLCNLQFTAKAESGIYPISVEVVSLCAVDEADEEVLMTPPFTVIEGNVYVVK